MFLLKMGEGKSMVAFEALSKEQFPMCLAILHVSIFCPTHLKLYFMHTKFSPTANNPDRCNTPCHKALLKRPTIVV